MTTPLRKPWNFIVNRLLNNELAGQQKLIPIEQFCEGTIHLFQQQLPPISDTHDWRSRCEHLQSGPVCALLEQGDLSKLCDVRDARCTLPELRLYCDWFLDRYLGSYFRFKMENPPIGSGVILELAPDFAAAVEYLKKSTIDPTLGKAPRSWVKHIQIQTHKYIREFVTEKIPCGNCFHYSHSRNLCICKSRKKWQQARGCSQFRPIAVQTSYVPRTSELTELNDRINQRAVYLLANLVVKRKSRNTRGAVQLARLHATLLHWDKEGTDATGGRDRLAEKFGVTTKTIDRDRIEIVKLLQGFKKTDPTLKKLFDRRDDLLETPQNIVLEEEL